MRRAVAAGALGVLLASTPAGAASSVVSGWWTAAPVAFAPDVGDDQLLVQGGADGNQPLAYAGISFALASGETAETLVLRVAPGSGTTPGAALSLCPLGSSATPARGEQATLGPSFDCSSKVDAGPSADGASYEFDVSGLGGDRALDVAVLPTSPTDRVVLLQPALDALRVGTAGSSAFEGSDGGFSDGGFSEGGAAGSDALGPGELSLGDVAGPGPALGGVASGAFDLPAVPAPAGVPAVAAAPTDTGRAEVGLAATAAAQRAATSGSSRSVAPFVFGGLLAAAATLWALAGRSSGTSEFDIEFE
jgi:hypothetical protein